MEIKSEKKAGITILRLTGRLDSATGGEFESRVSTMIDNGGGRLALDASGLDFVSSAGLRALLQVTKKARSAGGSFCLFGLGENLKEILDMTGFSGIIPLYTDEETATKE